MKTDKYILKLVLSIVFAIVPFFMVFSQSEYYRRHYVIVVDQGMVQGHPNTIRLYQNVKDLFVNNKSLTECGVDESIPNFDEGRDQISIFASGISRNDYIEMFHNCRSNSYNRSAITNVLVDKLFHRIGDFRSTSEGLETYLDNTLKPLMNAQWKERNLSDCHLGLNEYLYPLVLYKLDVEIPSERYYFIIVSNFTAQGAIHTVREQQLKPLLYNDGYLRSFDSEIDRWKSYFYENDFAMGWTPYDSNDITDINNNPKINYFKLGVKSLESVGISIQSFPQYSQQKLHGNDFSSTSSSVVFNHPDNLKIERIWAEVVTSDTKKFVQYKLGDEVTTQREGDLLIYRFDGKKDIDLGKLQPSDDIETQYYFSSNILNSDSTPLLPMIHSTSCSYEMQAKDFIPEPETIPTWAQWTLCIFVLILMGILLYYIWRKRGKRVEAVLENVHFAPVSRERYMDVSDMKVKEYDCWYMDPEAQKTQVKLEIKGVLRVNRKTFAKDIYRVRLEFSVKDVDFDDNFTFRPIGKDNNGVPYAADCWYRVEVEETGEFTIPIMAYLDIEKHPELENISETFWSKDHVLKTQVDFRAILIHKNEENALMAKKLDVSAINEIWKTHPITIYEFIARPTFNLRNSWVAFDPGTSGGCAAFITGGNIDTLNNIHIVHDVVKYGREQVYEPVFPSKIIVKDEARAFRELQPYEEITEVNSWEESSDSKKHADFVFGWKADRLVARNSFQSIKKLLGYTNTQSIINERGKEIKISGKLLAQLLVKGLYEHTKKYIMDLYQEPTKFRGRIPYSVDPIDVKNQYFEGEIFTPRKAIVAVPNNYTLPKVQEMVNTVKALGQFKEVHYLYESEGILMEYCHRNWLVLDQKKRKLIVVFDMGGATINATAFVITETKKDNSNNITDIVIKTVGKIGYCVGGDDIDYAIIQQIYAISAIKKLYQKTEDLKHHMATHKQLLIKLARELKLAIIAKNNGQKGGILETNESFYTHVMSYAKDMGWPQENVEFSNEDYKIWMNADTLCTKSEKLQSVVYSKIKDSVQELFASMDRTYKNLPVEVIFGGRSTLFPRVRETVLETLPSVCKNVWDGLENEGKVDPNAVKTAVASGACWYANFSQHITIEHSVITTAFGYLDHQNGKEIFVPMIEAGEKFKNGLIQKEMKPLAPALLREVMFVQMQGADHEKILNDFRASSEQKHKMNILDKVAPESDVTQISVTLDERFNFDYEISTAAGVEDMTPDNYPYSRLHVGAGVKTEIADENNESYLFAAISSQEEIKEQQKVINSNRF